MRGRAGPEAVSVDALLVRAQEALLLAVMLSLPVLLAALLVGVLVSIFQATTQIQDATLAHLPRLVAVALCLAAVGPWMARHIAGVAARIFAGG
jgi:flagellar biosynthesis protein FliQ